MAASRVKLLDREETFPIEKCGTCEELWRLIARKELKVKPAPLELFCLTYKNDWLSPSEKPPVDSELELRIRFKPPCAERLKDADKAAFGYYFAQIRHDLRTGLLLKSIAKDIIKDYNSKSDKWYLPVVTTTNPEEAALARKKRVKFLTTVVKIVSLIIVIDILEQDHNKQEVMKNFESYLPNEIWANAVEKKLLGLRNLKQQISRNVDHMLLDAQTSIEQRKLDFLEVIEFNFSDYFVECYKNATFRCLQSKQVQSVVLKIVPPFKFKLPAREETVARLVLYDSAGSSLHLCNIEDICNIATSPSDSDGKCIEIARRNGVPLNIVMEDEQLALSFITSLTGYFRLCEKWIFSLCPDIIYPSLATLQAGKVHGPIDTQFVIEKFQASPERQQAGTYLIRRSCDNHFTYFLHYVIVSSTVGEQTLTERSLRAIHIIQSEETGLYMFNKNDLEPSLDLSHLQDWYTDISSLVKDITEPLGLKGCLHPSEYDRAPTLLICRSDIALGNDITGQDHIRSSQKVFVPISALSRLENVKVVKGQLTKVWKALWMRDGCKEEVAIKQLKKNDSHLLPFMQMCSNAMQWNDPTLIKVHGASLATQGNPMALIMEYLPLGPLDVYLKKNRESIEKEDLLEAAVSLARALLHLEEQKIVHGSIRLRNVLVAQHGESLMVKLGDPGLPDYSCAKEVHWLSFELLIDSCPTPSKCTNKGDVWAFATTLWELFSFGELPPLDPVFSREQYLNGHRLAMPNSLRCNDLSSIYGVMQGCWNPMPDARNSPHSILRDLNQLLYKAFNAKKVHTYVTLSDDNNSMSSPSHSSQTDQVLYLSSNTDKPSPHSSFESCDDYLHSFGDMPGRSNSGLAPLFTNWMQQHFGRHCQGTSWTESHQNLMDNSRSASSLEGSVVNSLRSQFTMQTSVSSLNTLTSQYSLSVYQINETQISLNKDRPLGEGNFGIVYKGVWTKSNGDWEEVAVKMLKCFNDPASEAEIERELNLMRRLDHDNIVRIHGAFSVTDTGNTAFAMEFVREGSLDNYLRTHKNHMRIPLQLFIFADNICEGMIYLSREGIIHRDLAARNILVASDERVKISDFGLARQPQGKDYYTMSSHTNIPVKWMAVESLSHGIFHKPSDVWSFGVVLWEMFTFGESPYLDQCQDFFKADQSDEMLKLQMASWIQRLHEGIRFPKPEICPSLLYSQVMLSCWDHEPNNRPTFLDLRNHLTRIEKQVT